MNRKRHPMESAAARAEALFMRAVQAQPMLSREREISLAERSSNGDQAALTELVNTHLRFVISIARKYRNYGVPMNDLVQEGTLGLIQAVRKYDPGRDARLATYAMWWIRASIQDHVLRSWSLVRVGTTTAHKSLFFRLRRMLVDLKDSADLFSDERLTPLAQRFSVPLSEVKAMAMRAAGFDQSLNRPLANDETEEWLDHLADDDAPDPETLAAEASEIGFWHGLIEKALGALPRREARIIRARYLADAVPTRDALAHELGISKERVRQLELRALGKIRAVLLPMRWGTSRAG